jgi:hypothetical protein
MGGDCKARSKELEVVRWKNLSLTTHEPLGSPRDKTGKALFRCKEA